MSKMLTIFCRYCNNEFQSNGPEYCSPKCAKTATGDGGQTKYAERSPIIIPGLLPGEGSYLK